VGATYGECRRANKRCKLPPRPKKPHESWAGRGKGRGLGGAAPPFASSKMGRRGRRGGRGSSKGASVSGIVSI